MKSSEDAVVTKTIKLSKVYKLGTSIKLTLKKNGATYSKTYKIYSGTALHSVKATKNKLKVKVYNLHKGDIVKVTYKSKTYTKVMKKSYNSKYHTVTFTPKKKLTKKSSLKCQILNKNKKVLVKKKTIKLAKWEWKSKN
jgi:hypothetical protein